MDALVYFGGDLGSIVKREKVRQRREEDQKSTLISRLLQWANVAPSPWRTLKDHVEHTLLLRSNEMGIYLSTTILCWLRVTPDNIDSLILLVFLISEPTLLS